MVFEADGVCAVGTWVGRCERPCAMEGEKPITRVMVDDMTESHIGCRYTRIDVCYDTLSVMVDDIDADKAIECRHALGNVVCEALIALPLLWVTWDSHIDFL